MREGSTRCKTFSWQSFPLWWAKFEDTTIRGGELVLRRVEREFSTKRHGGNDCGRGEEVHGILVAVIARLEISILSCESIGARKIGNNHTD